MPKRFSTRSRSSTAERCRPRRATRIAARAQSLRLFAANLEKAFYGFEPDFFQQNLLRIVDDVSA